MRRWLLSLILQFGGMLDANAQSPVNQSTLWYNVSRSNHFMLALQPSHVSLPPFPCFPPLLFPPCAEYCCAHERASWAWALLTCTASRRSVATLFC